MSKYTSEWSVSSVLSQTVTTTFPPCVVMTTA